MIDIDNLEKFITDGVAQGDLFSLRKEGWIELLTILRQAEKDAARYRELRDAESETCLDFINAKARMASPEWLDGMVDEYMKCK